MDKPEKVPCETCNGTGLILAHRGEGYSRAETKCWNCDGSGMAELEGDDGRG